MWRPVLWMMAWGGWQGAAGELGQNMHNITSSLLDEMTSLMEPEVQYSEPVINVTYVASVEFDMRAMGPLYNSTHIVIDAISKKQAYPEGIVSVQGMYLDVKPLREEWRPLLLHYAGPVSIVVVVALFAAILPLAGLFWCCCYWCRVGHRRRPFDRKYDACLKGILAIVLIALLTLFLFGVVCAFATESQLEASGAAAAGSLRAGVADAREFLNATQAHARHLLVHNYRELRDYLDRMLYGMGFKMSTKLGEFSRAVSVTTLRNMVQQLDTVRSDLRLVRNLTAALRLRADRLNADLRRVKKQLLDTLRKCRQPKCVALQEKHKIGQLDTEIQYSQLPDVTDLLNNVSALLDSNIKEEVSEGHEVLREIQRGIQQSADKHVRAVRAAVGDAGRQLEALADRITHAAGNASAALLQHQQAAAGTLHAAYEQYGPYRRYVGVAAAAALLLITALMAWGLMCGVCGKRPDVYGASDCCNKGAGSKSLLCGMGAAFLVGGGVALVLLAYFVLGLLAQRFVCDPLTEPRGNRLFADLDKLMDLEKTMFNERSDSNFNMTSVLVDCHRNLTVYEALQLRRLYDAAAVRGAVARALAAPPPAYPARRPAVILRASAKRKLLRLADTGLSDFRFDRILAALETNMTSLALESLAQQLEATAASLPRPAFAEQAADLAQAAAVLADLTRDVLRPMRADAALLNTTAIKLRDGMRFNHPSLNVAISYLIRETEEAEIFLNTKGPEQLQNMSSQFADALARQAEAYAARVEDGARLRVGRCGPLSNAFNATRDAACTKMLMPVNGYWMALAWCVALLAPLLLVARRLARLYLHVDAYPGPLVDAEYLYDAYADRDNVPLANAYKAEKRAGREGRGRARGGGEGEGRGGVGGAGAGTGAAPPARPDASVAAPLDAYHARRYNDMAPKHWEEGPPRYHGPTEYERPPPYYYPGPNDRQ